MFGVEMRDCSAEAFRAAAHRRKRRCYADRALALRRRYKAQIKNVENPGVKSTPGATTSLRSAPPSSIDLFELQERINDFDLNIGNKGRDSEWRADLGMRVGRYAHPSQNLGRVGPGKDENRRTESERQ